MKSKMHFGLILMVGLMLLSSCKDKKFFRNEGFVFGTVYHITYLSTTDLQAEMEAELARFDAALSTFNTKSTLSRFNQCGTEPFDLNREPWMLKVVRESIKISEWSNGAFDITVAPLVNIWGFGPKALSNPTSAQIDSIRSFVGYDKIRLVGKKLSKTDPRIQLDCSAVAKGYASDVIAEFLRSKGVNDFMVEIGGEMVLSGKNPEGNSWRIGVNKPVDDSTSTNNEIEKILLLTDKAIATSGNYRKFYVKNGRKYAHTIDPHTGYPVQHSLLSTTIVADDCLTADALATACMVLGVDSAMMLIENHPGIEALFIYNEGGEENKLKFTSGIPALLVK